MNRNFLSPELFCLKESYYRVNPVNEMYSSKCPKNVTETSAGNRPYMEEDLYSDDEDDDDSRIETLLGGFKASVYIPQSLIKFVVGMKGATKKKIESETSTTLKVPSTKENGDISITGQSRKNVASAIRRIERIALESRMKLRPNCFTCIPLHNTEIKDTFIKWKTEIQNDNTIGIDEIFFQQPEKLHLTINVANILDDYDEEKANEILEESKLLVINPILEKFGQIEMKLKGVRIFDDEKPSSTRVLFGNVISEQVQDIANRIAESFVNKGLSRFEKEDVKMHVTLLNAKFAKEERRITFDSTKLLQKYENYEFGSVTVKELHLSKLGSVGNDGFYEPIKIINI